MKIYTAKCIPLRSIKGEIDMKKKYCVISHTHWDREWYMPFEKFRMRLCDLINNLFDIIEEYPDYVFHLDAQVIVLEDYLEIFPENRNKLEKYIKNGNIIVGPWYLQNDFYLTSGEATIRNLLIGTRMAKSFGACADVGYAPDQFGNISQLPQILNNFEIDNFVFGRGFNPYGVNENGEKYLIPIPSEFIWQGADGTKVLAVHLRRWYNNAQRFSADIKKATALVKRNESAFKNVAATPYLLLMNGVDHLEAQEDLLPILDKLNSLDINGEIRQTTMSDYIDSVKTYIKEKNIELETFSGELRKGGESTLLQGTLSSRSYLKVANVKAQNLIENRIEPLYSMLALLGFKGVYLQNQLRYLWKMLLKNHPHDSICGCSRDEVHRHMEDRYECVNEVGKELLLAGLEIAAYHNGLISSNEDYSIVLANTTCATISGIAEVSISFPTSENVTSFEIRDIFDRSVSFEVKEKIKERKSIFSPINLPGSVEVDTYKIYLNVSEMQPMSFICYKINTNCGELEFSENRDLEENFFENEELAVEVTDKGTVNITCKSSHRKLEDCIYLEDTADKGTSYIFVGAGDKPISSKQFKPTVRMIEKNAYKSVCSISYDMLLPECYDFENDTRSENKVIEHCELILTLTASSNLLEVKYKIDNKAKDHRLKLFVKTDVVASDFITDIPFDIVVHSDDDINPLTVDNVHPNTSFAAIESEKKAVAVFTEGEHECAKEGADTLCFTLVRATGGISYKSGRQWLTPENQCLRHTEGRVAVHPYNKNESSMLSVMSEMFRNPILSAAVPGDAHKFTGGRPAVQDTELTELFYREDKNKDVCLLDNKSLLCCSNPSVILTAFKKSEDNSGFIVRLFNSSASGLVTDVEINGKIYLSNMNECVLEYLGENKVSIELLGKQIKTLYIQIT